MAITVKIDYSRLAAKAASIAANLEREVAIGLDRVALAAVGDLKSTQSFEDRSGTLRSRFNFTGGGLRRTVNADTPYAKYLERGTKRKATLRSTAAAEHLRSGFRASPSVVHAAANWRITPRLFMEHARGVVKRMLKREMIAAFRRALGTRR